MGPLHALVCLAQRLGLHPFLETLTASEKSPLVAIDLKANGDGVARQLPEGTTIIGMRAWSRTGITVAPRAFRDDAKYTLHLGKFRDGYAEVVGAMREVHPEDPGLFAWVKFLRSERTIPKKQQVEGAQYVPYFRGRPVVDAILRDFDGRTDDPYGPPGPTRKQPDVITGEICVHSARKPVRLRGFGASTGVTLLSVEDLVTASHWRSCPPLQAPMSAATMNLHVAALQYLVDQTEIGTEGKRHRRWFQAAKRGDERLGIFAWCRESDGPESIVLDVLRGRATITQVEAWANVCRSSTDDFCMLALAGSRRLTIHGWSYLPLAEAAQNVLAYAKAMARSNGTIPGVGQIAVLTVPSHMCPDDPRAARDLANSRLDWQSISSLIDHIVEGHPFPWLLQQYVRVAFMSQDDPTTFHAQNQLTILHGGPMPTFNPLENFPYLEDLTMTQILGALFATIDFEHGFGRKRGRSLAEMYTKTFVRFPAHVLPQLLAEHQYQSARLASRQRMAQLDTIITHLTAALGAVGPLPRSTNSTQAMEISVAYATTRVHLRARYDAYTSERDAERRTPAISPFDEDLDHDDDLDLAPDGAGDHADAP